VILAKTPFRVSLVGGGTDLPEFYRRTNYGAVVSLAIDRYMYVMIHPYFHEKLRVKYSRTEDVDSVDQLQHPIVRECLRMMDVTSGVEIASIADIPAGLGLGSSSSFTVCLLHALNAHRGQYATKERLAAEACCIEIERLGEPIGKQDQYAAAYGGLNYIRFLPDDSVEVEPLTLNAHVTGELLRRLLLFYVGSPRSARDVLAEQRQTISEGARFADAERLAALAGEMRAAITRGQLGVIGEILHEGWRLKKGLASNITTTEVDQIYDTARRAGAAGGKLLGAGSGGFMLFYCEPHFQPAVRAALHLRELPLRCDTEGSKIIYHDFNGRS
jgi:D-glycero-alpha-D-manno-heptose-7-phosphate kinase